MEGNGQQRMPVVVADNEENFKRAMYKLVVNILDKKASRYEPWTSVVETLASNTACWGPFVRPEYKPHIPTTRYKAEAMVKHLYKDVLFIDSCVHDHYLYTDDDDVKELV